MRICRRRGTPAARGPSRSVLIPADDRTVVPMCGRFTAAAGLLWDYAVAGRMSSTAPPTRRAPTPVTSAFEAVLVSSTPQLTSAWPRAESTLNTLSSAMAGPRRLNAGKHTKPEAIDKRFFYVKTDFRYERRRLP